MRCLTHKECAAWCRGRGYPVLGANPYGRTSPGVEDDFELLRLEYPKDSGQRLALVKRVIEWLAQQGEILIWVTDWSAWPSSQHMPLFARLREACGEPRPLMEAPGHLLASHEVDDAVSVGVLAALFYWDCYALPSSLGPVFHCSHDEWCGFFVPPGTGSRSIPASLAKQWSPPDS